MKAFTTLYFDIDSSTKTNEKLAAMKRYFAAASNSDAAWALFFLTGRTLPRAVNTAILRLAVTQASKLPLWLIEESYDAVGDLAETMALLAPGPEETVVSTFDLSLSELVEQKILPLRALDDESKLRILLETWASLDVRQRLVWNKLITGSFRIGVARTLVERALSELAGVTQATMAHRLMGAWQPSAEGYRSVIDGGGLTPVGQPYPFMLAYSLDDSPDSLGNRDEWAAEWKWDGIRAQLIRRAGQILVWSRGEERVTDVMPEVMAIGESLPDGTVLDGEILAWKDGTPLPFAALQRRLNRKTVGAKLMAEAPVSFMAYDILEHEGKDIRSFTLDCRRDLLEELVDGLIRKGIRVTLSPRLSAFDWQGLRDERLRAREIGSEGLMLKRREGTYGSGRQRGNCWKWKIDPYTVDAVMVYAQAGHGRRASLFTDYTFAVWSDGALLPIAKAYSGLTDAEIAEVDRFVRRHTLEKHGPVRVVEPSMVFEIAFEGIQLSPRHKSGIAVRFPRIARIRTDKKPEDADTLDQVKALLAASKAQ